MVIHSFKIVALPSFRDPPPFPRIFQIEPGASFHTRMADPEVRISIGDSGANEDDVQMQRGDSADVMEVGETAAVGGNGAEEEETVTMEEEGPAARLTFVECVRCLVLKRSIGLVCS